MCKSRICVRHSASWISISSVMGAVREFAITVKTEAMRTHNAVWGRFLSTEEEKEKRKKKSGLKGTVAAVELRRKAPPGGALALFPPTYRELDPTQGAMIDRRLEPPMKDRVGLGASINFSALLLPLPPPPSPDPTRHPLEASTASARRPRSRLRPLTDEGGRAGGC